MNEHYSYYLLSSGEHATAARGLPDSAQMVAAAGNWARAAEFAAREAYDEDDISVRLSWPITVVLMGKDTDGRPDRRLGVFEVSLDRSPRFEARSL